MDISLVIPAYNEEAIIKDTVTSVLDELPGKFGSFELIVVDDGSTDATRDIVSQLTGPNVSLIVCGENRGKGCAVRTGMLAARGDIVFFTDADLAYGLELIAAGAELLSDTGADVVVGSRKLDAGGYGGYSTLRLLASKCYSLALRSVSGIKYDTQCGFKGFRLLAAHDIFRSCSIDGFSFDFEALMLASSRGYKIVQLPARILNHRPTRLNVAGDGIKMLADIMTIRHGLQKSGRKAFNG